MQDRITPASTAFAGGVLTIDYTAASEAITVANTGGNISLSGSTFTGAGGGAFSGVNRIVATDSGGFGGQSLTFGGASTFVLTDGLNSAGVETVTFNREVNASGGSNSIDVTAPQNIVVAANLTGGTAGVQLTGQGLNALSTTGIDVQYILISAAGNGPVSLTGTGGTSGGGGVVVFGTVTSGGGPVSVSGNATGAATVQTGVAVYGTIGAGGSGAVTVSGHGNAVNNGFNYGINVNGGSITSSGGNVSVSGESLGRATYVQYGSITAGGLGSVTVSGLSPNDIGIYVATQGFITSNGGPVLATGSGSIGVFVFRGTLTAGGNGSVSVVGSGSAAGSYAVRVDDSSSKITSSGGPISISTNTATGGNGLALFSGSQLSTTNNASITITSDAFAIGSSPNSIVDAGTGTVTIQPQTPGTRISLGGGDNSASNPRTLGISVFELGQITAGTLHIGNASAGPIVFDPAYTGGGSGGPPVTLESGEPVVLTTDLSVDIDGSSASLNYSQVTVAGSIDLNGVGLILNGSYVPVAGDSYPIINNTGSAAILHAFAAKPEGTILTFNGAPLRLSYVGGNGNDVVLTHPTPVISGVSPGLSPDAGGATITLNGTGFTGATSVTVDGVPVAFNFISDMIITFISPAHAVGAVDIVVVNPTYGSSSTAGSGNDLAYVIHSSVALDGSNDLVIASSASVASANAYSIVRNAANLVITDVFPFSPTSIPGAVLSNGGLTLTIPLASLPGSRIVFDGGAGNDSLVVDHSGGAFGKTIAWNGGAPTTVPGDSLTIAGNGQGTVTYNYTNAHDGSVMLSNFGTIEYTGLEPITNTGTATDIVFNLPAGPNAATLADDGTPGNGLIRLSGATFETTTFANPSGSLTINRGSASDTIDVQFHVDFTAPLTLGSAANPFADIALTLPTGSSTVTLTDDGIAGNGLSRIIGATSAAINLANPTGSLTINRGNASDTITIHSLPDFTASLTIGSVGNSFNTATVAEALTTTANLTISAGLIAANANITTAGHLTFNGPVQLSGSRVFNATAAGNITFANTIDATTTGVDELFVNPSNAAAGKVFILGNSGATTRLGQWSVYSPIETRLGGSVFTDRSGGKNGLLEFGGTPKVVLTASVTLDTESGNDSAGEVGFYGTVMTADAPGRDLTIDTSSGAGLSGGRQVVGTFNGSGGGFLNDVIMNAAGGSGSGDMLFYSGAILLDNSGADIASFTIAAGNASSYISGGLTVDTEQGDDSDAGSINFGTGTIFGGSYGLTFDSSTAAAGKLAGNLTLPGINPGDVPSLTIAVNGPTAASTGTVTLSGAISLAANASISITASAINLSTSASDLSASGTGEISLVAYSSLNLASGASLVTANRAISLTSDQIAIDVSGTPATINAGSSTVALLPNTANRPIHLGAADSGSFLGLTDGELDRITAGVLRIGSSSAGAMTIEAALTPGGTSVLHLMSGGDIDQLSSGKITVSQLAVESGGHVDLEESAQPNETAFLAINATHYVEYRDASGLEVTTVDGIAGVQSATVSVSLTTVGDLIVQNTSATHDIFAGNSGINLNTGGGEGTFRVMSGASVRAIDATIRTNNLDLVGTLSSVTAGGNFIFEPAAGVAINLGATSDAAAATLEISAAELNNITTTNMQIQASGAGSIMISQPVAPAHLSGWLYLGASGGAISQSGTGSISVGQLMIDSAGAVSLGTNANDVDTIEAVVTSGNITFLDSDGFTTGGVTSFRGLRTGSGSVTLTAQTGDITVLNASSVANDIGGTGAIQINLGGDNAKFTVSSGANIQSTGGDHTYTADKVNILGTINAGSQVVFIRPNDSTETIDLGSATDAAVDTLELSDAELDRITATTLRIQNTGFPSVAPIVISQALSPANVNTLSLYSASSVSQSAGATIIVPKLGILGSGAVSLGESNDVDTFAVNIGNGTITFVDIDGFTAGVADFAQGLNTNAGNINLTAVSGNITIAATGLTPDLEASGSIAITLSGDEALFTLAASATAQSGLGTTIVADKMTIAGTITATGQTVTLKPAHASEAINLGSTTEVAGNTLELSDAELDRVTASVLRIGDATSGAIQQMAAISPANASTLVLTTGAGVGWTSGALTVASLAIRAQNNVALSGANDVTNLAISAGTAGSGLITFNESNGFAVTTVDGLTGLTTPTGAISIAADDLNILQPISTATTVALRQSTTSRPVNLGVETAGSLSLTDAELDRISAVTTLIGDGNTGTMTIGAAITHANNLTLATGAGLISTQSITMAVNKNLTATAVSTASFPAATSDWIASGSGSISLTTQRDVSMPALSSIITTVDGNLTISANQQTTATAGNFIGVDVSGGTIQATGTGAVTVQGRGGNNSAGAQIGVNVALTGKILGGTSASLTILGTGGASTGASNVGVYVINNLSAIGSGGANVIVTGVGGGGITSPGVVISTSGSLAAGGNGTTTVTGTGGTTAGSGNYGVSVAGATISSNSGNVFVTGIAGNTTNEAVRLQSSATISSGGTANVTVTGDSLNIDSTSNIRGGASNGGAVLVTTRTAGTLINLGAADVLSGSLSLGLLDAETDRFSGATITVGDATSGNMTISAAIGHTTTGEFALATGGTITTSATTSTLTVSSGNITLTANDMAITAAIAASSRVSLVGNGTRAIDLGTNTAGTLGLTDTELDLIAASTTSIGYAAGGAITVSAALTHPNNLTLTTGAGITANQSIAMGAGKSLTATALGTISLPNSTSDFTASGIGGISLTTARNVSLQSGASIVTTNGNVSVLANQQTTPTSGNFAGVNLTSGLIQATGSGTVTVRGKGGDNSAGSQFGIAVQSGGDIIGGTSGLLIVEGIGGAGTGSINLGIYINGSGSTITSGGGNVQVTGTGGETGLGSNSGISLSQGQIAAGGSGSVSVTSTGGMASTGGNAGLYLSGGGAVTSAGGNVSVVATGGSVGTGSTGVEINSSGTISAGTGGTVFVQGTGGSGSTSNTGVYLIGSAALITSTSGLIDIVGIGAIPGAIYAVSLVAGGAISSGANAEVRITTDGLNVDTGATPGSISAGTGIVSIQTRTAGTLINLGGTDAFSGSPLTLGLTDGELDRVTAGTLNIGTATSGALTVSADATRATSTNIALTSNADIVINAAISTGGGTLSLAPGATSASVKPLKSSNDITASSTSFTSGRDLTINIAGRNVDTQYNQLNVAGAVNLANVDLILTGSFVPAFDDAFVIVSATSVSGTFNGYANNAVFLLNGVQSQITYTTTAVTIKSINNPVIVGGDTAAYTISENVTHVATITATDVDLPPPTFSYSIVGGVDASKFQINASTGALAILAPDFETPTDANADNIYEVIVQVSDGYLTDSQAISVTVTNVNETPIIAQPSNAVARISTDAAGAQAISGASANPVISDDGRYMVFESSATNLVAGDTNGVADIFRKDLLTGAIVRVNTDGANAQVAGTSNNAAISADGRYVVFMSSANNLVTGDTNGSYDIFRKDMLTGAIVRVSVDSSGIQGNSDSQNPAVSGDGRYVVFSSSAANLVLGDSNGYSDVFRKDLQTGAIVRVSTTAGGVQGNQASQNPIITADGRYVVFDSYASNLVVGDTNGTYDVFRKDVQTGATVRVSVDASGVQATGGGQNPTISADGRYVAFSSAAANLVVGDTNNVYDAFRKDILTGAIARVNLDANGGQTGDSSALSPIISADGRYVVFSSASYLVPGDSNGSTDIFRKDLQTNAVVRISVDSAGIQANNSSVSPAVTPDGRLVVFQSSASNLVAGDTNGSSDIFTWTDGRVTGVAETALASVVGVVSVDGPNAQGNNVSFRPALSSNGAYVFFSSAATNLVALDSNSAYDIFRRDLQTGEVIRASADTAGVQGNNNSYNPVASADGRYVVFYSYATNLVAGDTNGAVDIFRKDLQTGDIVRVSVDASNAQANGDSFEPVVSADGRYVVFRSNASNLVANDTNLTWDLFRKDLQTGTVVRVTTDGANAQANADSYEPAISADGRYVAFRSNASNLVVGDTNAQPDIFRKDLQTNAIVRVSTDGSNGQAAGDSYEPAISADGRFVAFRSLASNLVLGDTNGSYDIFRKDLQTGAIVRASVDASGVQGNGASYLPSISADGRFVSFYSGAGNLIAYDGNGYIDVFRKDLATGAVVRVGSDVGGGIPNNQSANPAMSTDGRVVAFESPATNLVTSDLNGTTTDVFLWTDIRTISVPENSLAAYDFSATDPDAGQTPTYSIAGGADAALFQIHSTTGVLSFIAPPDFESPADANGDNTYQVIVQTSDGTLVDTQRVAVAVTNGFTGYAKIYVDDDWSALLWGTVIADADSTVSGNQPATIGIDAFASLAAGAEAVVSGGTAIVYSGSYAATVSLPSSFTVNVPSGTATFSGSINGSGGLTKIGTGTLVLAGSNSFTGGLTISRGKVQVSSDAALGDASGSVIVNAPAELVFTDNAASSRSFDLNDGNLSVAAAKTLTFNGGEILGGVLNGPGAIATTAGASVLFYSTQAAPGLSINAGGSETFTNFINKGTLTLADAALVNFENAAGGQLAINGIVTASGFLTYGQTTLAGTGSLANTGASGFTFGGGSVTTITASATLDIGAANALVSGGFITNYGYFGAVGRTVVVDFAGRVQGPGTFLGPVITQNGGAYSPGNSPGPATHNTFPINGGGVFDFEIANATGAAGNVNGWDLATVMPIPQAPSSATIALTATSANKYTILLTSRLNDGSGQTAGPAANFNPVQNYAWKFIDGSHIATTITGTFDPTAFSVATSGFANNFTGSFSVELRDSGKNLYVVYTAPVPAPTVTSLAPVIGPTTGGTLVSIIGSNFVSITTVSVGGVALALGSYTVVSDSQITAIMPAHAAGSVDVSVANASGTGSLVGATDFTYAKPAVSSVQINGGPNATLSGAGTTVSLLGQNSVVRQIQVTFNQAVTVASDAFTVTPRVSNVTVNGGAAPSTLAVSTSVTPLSPSEYLVTFSGLGTHSGVIHSGIYDLTTLAGKVTANGDAMVANRVDSFFAMFGTIDGNNSYTAGTIGNGGSHAFVDPGSLFQFSDAFGSSAATPVGSPAYNRVFDANLDGFIDPGDLFAFSDSFGIDWVF